MFVSGAYGGFSSSGASELVSDVEPVSEVATESEVITEVELPVEAASEVADDVDPQQLQCGERRGQTTEQRGEYHDHRRQVHGELELDESLEPHGIA